MPDSEIKIRPASLSDVDHIAGFNVAMAAETEGKDLDLETVRIGTRQAINDPSRCRYFVAELDGRLAGQTMFTTEWSEWRNRFSWWIQSVYVAPEFRGRGVFRALFEHVRALAKARPDVGGLRLYVHRSNEPAMRVYERLGMTLTEYRVYEEEWGNDRT